MGAGEIGEVVKSGSQDEFGDLAKSFNQTIDSLRSESNLSEQKNLEMKSACPPGAIFVSQNICDRLHDLYDFEQVGEIQEPGKEKLLAWQLKSSQLYYLGLKLRITINIYCRVRQTQYI